MSVTRKRGDLALGPDRALGVQGIRIIDTKSNRQSGSTKPAVTYTGAKRGDLILAMTYAAMAATSYAVTSSGLSFSVVSDTTLNGMRVQVARAWNPDETASRTVTLDHDTYVTALVVLVLRGVDPATPIDVTPVHTGHAAASPFTVPSISTATARALAVLVAGSGDDNTLTAASPWTAADVANIGSDRAFGVWQRTVAAAGGIGTTEVTETTNGPDTAHSAVFAVRALAG